MRSAIDIYVIEQVRKKREKARISQRTLSEIVGRALGFVSQVESDTCQAKYSVHQLYIIAKELDCPITEFFPPSDWEEPTLSK